MTTSPERAPNLYQVHGAHLHVTYATTSFTGGPRFTYQDANGTQSFEGDAIRTAETEIGTLVTVTIARTVDAGSTSFTLLVPRVNLGQANQVPITTEGVTTLHRFSIVPALNTGQLDVYRVVGLTGTASAVEF